MNSFSQTGYQIHRGIFSAQELKKFRVEAEHISLISKATCIRHLRNKSIHFDKLAFSPLLLSLISKGLSPVRSILFNKTAEENWPVLWHQDLTISVTDKIEIEGYGPWSTKDNTIHVQPPLSILKAMVTIRIHLDHTPTTNGALRVIPGSHFHGRIPSDKISDHIDGSKAIDLECEPGDILLMSPLILHSSRKATTPSNRRVIHYEYAYRNDLDTKLNWFESKEYQNE